MRPTTAQQATALNSSLFLVLVIGGLGMTAAQQYWWLAPSISADTFRRKLPELTAAGFPSVSHWNGKRFLPAIIQFWYDEHSKLPAMRDIAAEERAKENFE